MLSGIEREVDGAAFEESLLSPGAKQLVSGQQVEAGGLLADGRGGRERGEEIRFARDDSSGRDAEQEKERMRLLSTLPLLSDIAMLRRDNSFGGGTGSRWVRFAIFVLAIRGDRAGSGPEGAGSQGVVHVRILAWRFRERWGFSLRRALRRAEKELGMRRMGVFWEAAKF